MKHTTRTTAIITNRTAEYLGETTFTELRHPNGKPGIMIRTNDARIKALFPGRPMSGAEALANLVSGRCRVLDLELPARGASKHEIEEMVTKKVAPLVLADCLK